MISTYHNVHTFFMQMFVFNFEGVEYDSGVRIDFVLKTVGTYSVIANWQFI